MEFFVGFQLNFDVFTIDFSRPYTTWSVTTIQQDPHCSMLVDERAGGIDEHDDASFFFRSFVNAPNKM